MKPGVLEGYFDEHPLIEITKTEETYQRYSDVETGIYRGFIFKPVKDIKIKAIGCMVPEQGTYKILISNGSFDTFTSEDTVFICDITINDINNFQFVDIDQELVLSANEDYSLLYFRKNPDHYHTAKYNWLNQPIEDWLSIPVIIGDVEIQLSFYMFGTYDKDDGSFSIWNGSGNSAEFLLKGLVDLKYELVE